MITKRWFTFEALLILLLVGIGCGAANSGNGELPTEVTSFAARKESQARELAKRFGVDASPDIWRYFAAAKKGDFAAVNRLWEKLRKRAGQYD